MSNGQLPCAFTIDPAPPHAWGATLTLRSVTGLGITPGQVSLVGIGATGTQTFNLTPESWTNNAVVVRLPQQPPFAASAYTLSVQTAAGAMCQAALGIPPQRLCFFTISPAKPEWGATVTLQPTEACRLTGGFGNVTGEITIVGMGTTAGSLRLTPSLWTPDSIVVKLDRPPFTSVAYLLSVSSSEMAAVSVLPVVTLPCDIGELLRLVRRVYGVAPRFDDKVVPNFDVNGVEPGKHIGAHVSVLPAALTSDDPLIQLLLHTAEETDAAGHKRLVFGLEIFRSGAGVGQDYARLRRSPSSTPTSQVPIALDFLPKPDIAPLEPYRARPGPVPWTINVRVGVRTLDCATTPLEGVLWQLPFSLLPLAVPSVAFVFDHKDYEQGFFVATPGIPGVLDEGVLLDARTENVATRRDRWRALHEVLSKLRLAVDALSVFGPPFQFAQPFGPLYMMLEKASNRAASEGDFAFVAWNKVPKLSDVYVWHNGIWGVSVNDLASSLFLISVPQGPKLTLWENDGFVHPIRPPAFRVPAHTLCASLTTLWSVVTDSVSPLIGSRSDYPWWTGDEFFYNKASSYAWSNTGKEIKDNKDQKDSKDKDKDTKDKEKEKERKDKDRKDEDKLRKENDLAAQPGTPQSLVDRIAELEQRLADLEAAAASGRPFIGRDKRPDVGADLLSDADERKGESSG